MKRTADTVTSRVPARAGLVGNPSDGYGGRVLAVAVENYAAEVTVRSANGISISVPETELPSWSGLDDLVEQTSRYGHDGSVRLITAALTSLAEQCHDQRQALPNVGFEVSYTTTIPRQVGLAGSSALVIAAQTAVAEFCGVDVPVQARPTLALLAETSRLGITAGLQDRVCQVMGGAVYMDFDPKRTEQRFGLAHGRYEALDLEHLPDLFLAHLDQAAEPSEVFHGDLRMRYERREPLVVDAMRQLASLTAEAHAAVKWRAPERIGPLMDASFDIRRAISDLPPLQEALIDAARAAGAHATFAGSGGAIVGTIPAEGGIDRVRRALAIMGAETIPLQPTTTSTTHH